ncbi:ribosomal protein S5 domain 2-type protein [Blastocladiella britannica]|nr:ribosomal protein S5 domain 2-type protein [Blastocladiella britannica]
MIRRTLATAVLPRMLASVSLLSKRTMGSVPSVTSAALRPAGLPASPAYFTGNAKYYDAMYEVQTELGGAASVARLVAQVNAHPGAFEAVRRLFKSKDMLTAEHKMNLSDYQYATLVAHLTALRVGDIDLSLVKPATAAQLPSTTTPAAAVADASEPAVADEILEDPLVAAVRLAVEASPLAHVSPLVARYLSRTAVSAAERTAKKPDSVGRVSARGSRKTSRAFVYVVPGDGQYMVNGTPLASYFLRREAETAAYPLQVARVFGKFNIWAIVNGGGPTGQAEATAVAVARAVAVHEGEHAERAFEAVGLLESDSRQVERKKPGQKKARKKFAWVKR